ncbi:TRAP transporter substrate-binding protein [Telmatospirillum sp. J64-1]|uniref:TRAP transporter substrate-binding protein n=1 Tax=Telmatospirillum sp. J64-1 TaxID=2502183 RepID=UPI00115C7ACA|nr:TRAP transporter substrate-binding protein [Telmatospirillum sp. J64-1]
MNRNWFSKSVAALAVTAALSVGGTAQAAEYTLKFSHFWPATSPLHTDIFQRWADTIEQESQGRIKVQVFPAQTLTRAAASYEGVTKRISEVAATAQGYTANRFPLSQVVELPGVSQNALQGSCILQTLYDEGLIRSEYEDTHPLFMFTHGPGLLHTKGMAVHSPADLAGKRLRRPTAVVGMLLEEAGAQPVGMPAPETYPSIQRGVIDGQVMPWEGNYVFRINELTEHHTKVNLYTLAFVATMNKGVYDGMPEDLKKVIDDNSGQKWARIAAEVFEDLDKKGLEDAVSRGHQIIELTEDQQALWQPVLERTRQRYVEEQESAGRPARQVFERAMALSSGDCAL